RQHCPGPVGSLRGRDEQRSIWRIYAGHRRDWHRPGHPPARLDDVSEETAIVEVDLNNRGFTFRARCSNAKRKHFRQSISHFPFFPLGRGLRGPPGTATGGTWCVPSHCKSAGKVSSVEFSASSQVTVLPEYVDMRPMIAVSVLSATVV